MSKLNPLDGSMLPLTPNPISHPPVPMKSPFLSHSDSIIRGQGGDFTNQKSRRWRAREKDEDENDIRIKFHPLLDLCAVAFLAPQHLPVPRLLVHGWDDFKAAH